MSRPQHPASIPTTSVSSSPFMQTAKSALGKIVKYSRQARARAQGGLIKNMEIQSMIDSEIFGIQSDRRTKLTPLQQFQLLHVLAQFFLERGEDHSKYTYFEAVFLGRENDPALHEFRMEIMLQLISFSLQFPVLQIFNHVVNYLGKINDQDEAKKFADTIVEVLTEHFVRSADNKNKVYEFLIPLEHSCAEITAVFIALAPLQIPINNPMCVVLASYLNKNLQFVLRHLRDNPYLGDNFAEKTLPKMVHHVISNTHESRTLDQLTNAICYILQRWNSTIAQGRSSSTKTEIDVIEVILDDSLPWSKRRVSLLAGAIGTTKMSKKEILNKMSKMKIPPSFFYVTDTVNHQRCENLSDTS
ncbi:unnamed protein product [Caenorhabditis bovis]|uniref:Uncharacterized protein n=1 Tax=Caenorhabditis bovis TaxID=2654633 RepID=A0A8S1EQW4_9PELO|nr:unnamed protein product [Caenorhabditis bovis]